MLGYFFFRGCEIGVLVVDVVGTAEGVLRAYRNQGWVYVCVGDELVRRAEHLVCQSNVIAVEVYVRYLYIPYTIIAGIQLEGEAEKRLGVVEG